MLDALNLKSHGIISKDTKNTQRGLKLHNTPSIWITEDFPSKNLEVLYKEKGTKSYIQTAYAHFRDVKRATEGLIRLPEVPLEVWDTREYSFGSC